MSNDTVLIFEKQHYRFLQSMFAHLWEGEVVHLSRFKKDKLFSQMTAYEEAQLLWLNLHFPLTFPVL